MKETIQKQIDDLKEENQTVLRLDRYDKQRKKVLDKNAPLIEELTNALKWRGFDSRKLTEPIDPDSNICDTAPYPECNGANGCDTCEHQSED